MAVPRCYLVLYRIKIPAASNGELCHVGKDYFPKPPELTNFQKVAVSGFAVACIASLGQQRSSVLVHLVQHEVVTGPEPCV